MSLRMTDTFVCVCVYIYISTRMAVVKTLKTSPQAEILESQPRVC